MTRRRLALLGISVVVFAVLNAFLWQRESLLQDGDRLYLRLQSAEEHALVKGETVRLRYEMAEAIERHRPDALDTGRIVVRADARDIAEFVRPYRGGPLGEGEHLLRWRYRRRVTIGPEICQIPERQSDRYGRAEYAALVAADSGTVVLLGLRDGNLESVGTGCGVDP